MIPAPFTFLVLALAAYRVTRLIGWDDFPLVARLRAWAVGEYVTHTGSGNAHARLTAEKTVEERTYLRPQLEHFLGCPFCVGFWVSVAFYIGWVFEPTPAKYVAAPWALAAAAALFAKNLDP